MPFIDGLALYHGSYVSVPSPDLSKCERFKDFGRGFYLTTSYEQARSFVRLSIRKALDRGLTEATAKSGYGPVGSASAESACIAQLMPERLLDQYCFRSEKALRCLSYRGSEQIWM